MESIESKYGSAGRIWMMDRGMVSEENIELLDDAPLYDAGAGCCWGMVTGSLPDLRDAAVWRS